MVYDFTDIDNITFVDYVNNRNFSIAYDEELIRPPTEAGDIGPEQMTFVPGNIYGEALLLVSNPQSASVTMYAVDCGPSIQETKPFTLYGIQISFIILIVVVIALIIVSVFVICLGYKHCAENKHADEAEKENQPQKHSQEKKQNATEETCDFILQTGHVSTIDIKPNGTDIANNIVFLDDEAMVTRDTMSMVVRNE
eukprot:UN00334